MFKYSNNCTTPITVPPSQHWRYRFQLHIWVTFTLNWCWGRQRLNAIVCPFQRWPQLRGKGFSWAKSYPFGKRHTQLLPRSFCSLGANKQNKAGFLLVNFTNEKTSYCFLPKVLEPAPCIPFRHPPPQGIHPEEKDVTMSNSTGCYYEWYIQPQPWSYGLLDCEQLTRFSRCPFCQSWGKESNIWHQKVAKCIYIAMLCLGSNTNQRLDG